MGTFSGGRVKDGTEPHLLHHGQYATWQGVWYGRCPNGLIAKFDHHEIVVHADLTISATPAIDLASGPLRWRGTLEHGTWKEG